MTFRSVGCHTWGMHVVDAPQLQPGCCAITGTNVGPFIDTLIDDDAIRPGRLYLAASTVTTMAELLGMKSELAFTRVKNKLELVTVELREAQEELARERELNQALINARADKESVHAS